jgi:hypothetical protein
MDEEYKSYGWMKFCDENLNWEGTLKLKEPSKKEKT